MGRPRKPTVLKIVAGTDRRSAGASHEPTPASAGARRQAPKHLSKDGAAAWRRMAPLCRGMGTLTVADLPAFERMCETWAEIRRLDRALLVLGSTTYECATKAEGIMRRPNPEVGQRSDAERRFLAYLSQFGLTPAARSKVARRALAARQIPRRGFSHDRRNGAACDLECGPLADTQASDAIAAPGHHGTVPAAATHDRSTACDVADIHRARTLAGAH